MLLKDKYLIDEKINYLRFVSLKIITTFATPKKAGI